MRIMKPHFQSSQTNFYFQEETKTQLVICLSGQSPKITDWTEGSEQKVYLVDFIDCFWTVPTNKVITKRSFIKRSEYSSLL